MDRKHALRSIAIPLLLLSLSIMNYARLSGTENIRAIHVVSLLAMGALFGVLLVNVVRYLRAGRSGQ